MGGFHRILVTINEDERLLELVPFDKTTPWKRTEKTRKDEYHDDDDTCATSQISSFDSAFTADEDRIDKDCFHVNANQREMNKECRIRLESDSKNESREEIELSVEEQQRLILEESRQRIRIEEEVYKRSRTACNSIKIMSLKRTKRELEFLAKEFSTGGSCRDPFSHSKTISYS